MSGKIFGACPFSAKELDGKTVEYEGPDYTTNLGRLTAEQNDQGQVCVEIEVPGAGESAAPVTFDTRFLKRHPKPKRKVDFLWAKHPARIVGAMGK